jgi:hypothetical protein
VLRHLQVWDDVVVCVARLAFVVRMVVMQELGV